MFSTIAREPSDHSQTIAQSLQLHSIRPHISSEGYKKLLVASATVQIRHITCVILQKTRYCYFSFSINYEQLCKEPPANSAFITDRLFRSRARALPLAKIPDYQSPTRGNYLRVCMWLHLRCLLRRPYFTGDMYVMRVLYADPDLTIRVNVVISRSGV